MLVLPQSSLFSKDSLRIRCSLTCFMISVKFTINSLVFSDCGFLGLLPHRAQGDSEYLRLNITGNYIHFGDDRMIMMT